MCRSPYFSIEKGLRFWYALKSQTTHFTKNIGPLTVSRKKADLLARVNGNLEIEFTAVGLTPTCQAGLGPAKP